MLVNPRFCWVVALQSEAKPLIQMFAMKILSNRSLFPIYFNPENGHVLVISGVGQVRSAAAAMFLRDKLDIKDFAAWINIGIAGCSKGAVASIHQALKVMNQESGKSFFPGTRFSKIVCGTPLITVGKPEINFSNSGLYDMEASGFCEIAPLFSCNELTYVFKIVSDTPTASVNRITKDIITSLIEMNTEVIFELVEAIDKLVQEEERRLIVPNEIQNALASYHFTETNRVKFQIVYKKWRSLFPGRSLVDSKQPPSSANDLIRKLENDLSVEAENWKLT